MEFMSWYISSVGHLRTEGGRSETVQDSMIAPRKHSPVWQGLFNFVDIFLTSFIWRA